LTSLKETVNEMSMEECVEWLCKFKFGDHSSKLERELFNLLRDHTGNLVMEMDDQELLDWSTVLENLNVPEEIKDLFGSVNDLDDYDYDYDPYIYCSRCGKYDFIACGDHYED